MESSPDAAGFPLGFEFLKRQRRKTFFGSTAATAEADEEVTVLNANLFGSSVGAGYCAEGTIRAQRGGHAS